VQNPNVDRGAADWAVLPGSELAIYAAIDFRATCKAAIEHPKAVEKQFTRQALVEVSSPVAGLKLHAPDQTMLDRSAPCDDMPRNESALLPRWWDYHACLVHERDQQSGQSQVKLQMFTPNKYDLTNVTFEVVAQLSKSKTDEFAGKSFTLSVEPPIFVGEL
jgi:hypothetical protein